MHSSSPTLLVEPAPPTLLLVNLAAVDAALRARLLLQPPPGLLIDCGADPCRRNLGVCYFLSQLVLLRRQGASVWLCNADPLLRRCLHALGLGTSFFLVE